MLVNSGHLAPFILISKIKTYEEVGLLSLNLSQSRRSMLFLQVDLIMIILYAKFKPRLQSILLIDRSLKFLLFRVYTGILQINNHFQLSLLIFKYYNLIDCKVWSRWLIKFSERREILYQSSCIGFQKDCWKSWSTSRISLNKMEISVHSNKGQPVTDANANYQYVLVL